MNPLPYPNSPPPPGSLSSHPEHPSAGLDPRHAERYLEATIQTAPPARLRLMLLERAVGVAGSLLERWRKQPGQPGANEQSLKLLDLLNELLSGVTADSGEVGQQVADLYIFLIQHLIAAEENSDAGAVEEIAVVLQTEAETWRMVCAQQTESASGAGGGNSPSAPGGLNLHA